MSDPLSIRKLIDRISLGDIRIPAFQRDYVWEPDQVAFLLDSIYKGFPIGTVILWRTDKRLNTEKKLGHFKLPEPQKSYPVNYVLDGQQRITSLFSAFQTDLKPESTEWVDIYFDMCAAENLQESLFLALDPGEVDLLRHFPIQTLFDPVEYRKATKGLDDAKALLIDRLQSRFKEYLIPNETFETDDRAKVAIVFERINRAGTELNVFELLSAWSWSDDFALVDKFTSLQEAIADHGFADLCDDKDLQLKICAGVITGETTPNKILDLQGAEIRSRFSEIERGILGALDFLKKEAGVTHYKLLPFPGVLVPLSVFFATDKKDGFVYTTAQKRSLLKWFWRSVFTRRFSADVNQRQAADIHELLQLKVKPSYKLKLPKAENKIDFIKSGFNIGTANSRALVLLLSANAPHSFLSGAKVDTNKVLKKASKHEFHHIFPRKYLLDRDYSLEEINCLANICFLTRGDNNVIKDKSPKEYTSHMDPDFRDQYLEEALCPTNIANLDFKKFVAARSALLVERANELMGL
jgi:hypothetical protein